MYQHLLIYLSRRLCSQGEDVYRPLSSFCSFKTSAVLEILLSFLLRGYLLMHLNIIKKFPGQLFLPVALRVRG